MDISIQAVEEQWTIAAARANTAGETTALMRAQLIATLLAAGYGTPKIVTADMTAEAVADWVAAEANQPTIIYTPPTAQTVEGIPVPGGVLIPDPEPEDEDDFFAEAKAVRKKR